jgi:hypothetical protein
MASSDELLQKMFGNSCTHTREEAPQLVGFHKPLFTFTFANMQREEPGAMHGNNHHDAEDYKCVGHSSEKCTLTA